MGSMCWNYIFSAAVPFLIYVLQLSLFTLPPSRYLKASNTSLPLLPILKWHCRFWVDWWPLILFYRIWLIALFWRLLLAHYPKVLSVLLLRPCHRHNGSCWHWHRRLSNRSWAIITRRMISRKDWRIRAIAHSLVSGFVQYVFMMIRIVRLKLQLADPCLNTWPVECHCYLFKVPTEVSKALYAETCQMLSCILWNSYKQPVFNGSFAKHS